MNFCLNGKRVWVAGHNGMVGSALVRRLSQENCEIITVPRHEADLRDFDAVTRFCRERRPDVVILAAAKVGGILANDQYPVDFLEDNLRIQVNVLKAAFEAQVSKFLFLGSSCIYPKFSPQPIREDALLTGALEPTNEWYAIAKIAGLKLAQAYRRQYGMDCISAMPTNLYGPGDNYHPDNSHVLPSLIRKAHLAKVANASNFVVWGSGEVRREFLHADDCADALVFLLQHYSDAEHINVGSGSDLTIKELAHLVAEVVGFQGAINLDRSRPDGTPRKLMDGRKLRDMGWQAKISLREGIADAYRSYQRTLTV